ncbi:hypothetical protein [Daejeonella sp.]|uniref:hypothetical protein n=1 Tax=Daejeonella sp. TaxID=2805397 RepID=UPI0030C10B2F
MEEARIIAILERMEKSQQKFFEETIAILRGGDLKPKEWGDIIDVQNHLKKSRRTVYRILANEKEEIRTRQILGTTWFYLPDFFTPRKKYSR